MGNEFKVNGALIDKLLASHGGWIDAANEEAQAHVDAGFIETDGEMDDDGDAFYQVTVKGMAWVRERDRRAASSVAKHIHEQKLRELNPYELFPAVCQDTDRDDETWNRPLRINNLTKRGIRASIETALKIEDLAVGESRHISCTSAIPEPWKSYQAVIQIANKRHARVLKDASGKPVVVVKSIRGQPPKPYPVMVYDKKFTIFRARKNDPRGPGARVLRIDPQNPEDCE